MMTATTLLLTMFAHASRAGADGVACDALAKLTLPNTTITSAQLVAAGQFTPPGANAAPPGNATPFANLPAFCRVAATLTPSTDSDIKIEIWMPAAGWNGKFLGVGNGGWS